MIEHVTNSERMNIFIYHLMEFNDAMKNYQRKENIKILGNCANIFEEKLTPFIPKILTFY